MAAADHNPAIEAARQRRIEMKGAVSRLETAAAAPAGDSQWRENLLRCLEELRIALSDHVEEVEGDDGLLAQLTTDAPRLTNRIERLKAEHPVLAEHLDDAIAAAKEPAPTEHIRTLVITTLLEFVKHRQSGADLIYEGYNVDIGGG